MSNNLSEFAKLIAEGKAAKKREEEDKKKNFFERYNIENTEISPFSFINELTKLKKESENIISEPFIKLVEESTRTEPVKTASELLSELAGLIQEGKKANGVIFEEQKEDIESFVSEVVQDIAKLKEEETINEVSKLIADETLQATEPIKRDELIEKTVQSITKVAESTNLFSTPDPDKTSPNFKAIQDKLKYLEQWVSKISLAGPGSGEVNLRYLDDVARETISDGLYLRYNEPTKKFVFDHGHQNAFYGAFQSTVTQTCGANTAVALTYNQTDFSYGITVTNNSRIVIQHPGLYNVQFSVQLTNSGTQIDRVYIWLRQNGQDVIGSAGKIDVPSSHGGAPGAILIGWNFYVNTTAANEYFEFMWFTPDEVHVTIPTLPAQEPVAGVSPYIPSTASVVLTVSPVKIN